MSNGTQKYFSELLELECNLDMRAKGQRVAGVKKLLETRYSLGEWATLSH